MGRRAKRAGVPEWLLFIHLFSKKVRASHGKRAQIRHKTFPAEGFVLFVGRSDVASRPRGGVASTLQIRSFAPHLLSDL